MRRYSEMLDRLLPALALISSLSLVVAVLYFSNVPLLYWEHNFLVDVVSWAALCTLGAGLLRYFVPAHAAVYLAAAVLLYLMVGIGLVQSAATALLIFSCYWYGGAALSLMFPQRESGSKGTQNILVGLALGLTLFGVMIHYQINYRSLYFAITLAPALVLVASGKLPAYWNRFSSTLVGHARTITLSYWLVALIIIAFSVLCRLVLIPTLGSDDNALHLGMWTQLSWRHIYSFDVVTQIWQVAPFAVDLLHAVLSMLAGEDARPALNLFLLAFLVRQLWVILGHFALSQSDRSLIVLLFISTPLIGNQLISLQTELFLATLIASGTRLALEIKDTWYSRDLAAILAVAAMCCATKLPGAYIGALLVLAAIIQLYFTQPRTLPSFTLGCSVLVAGFIGLLGILAFNSYFTAWWITGNPFFPLYNGIFKSPYYDAVNFVDDRWIKGFNIISYVKVFFTTSGYFESRDFVAGFQYLFLLPLGVIALMRRNLALKASVVLLPLFGFGLVMFAVTQYWRYVFPAFPLACVVIGCLLTARTGASNRSLLPARLAIILCIGLNVYFYPGISRLLSIPPASAYTQNKRQALIDIYTPIWTINKFLNTNAPGLRVLYPGEAPLGATLNGEPVYVNWYSPATLARAQKIRTEVDLATFLLEEDIDYVISFMADGSKPGSAKWLLREYLSHAGFPEYKMGDYILYRLLDHDITYEQAFTVSGTNSAAVPAAETPLSPTDGDLTASPTNNISIKENPVLLATLETGAARIARYKVAFSCAVTPGYFIAQVNWNAGTSYYRLIPCAEGMVNFAESFPVPAGTTQAEVYAAAWGITEITVSSLTLEIN